MSDLYFHTTVSSLMTIIDVWSE